jgi:ABC-2 type transport system permease protein
VTTTIRPPLASSAPVAAPGPAVVGLALRQVRRGTATVAVVAAGMSAVVVATYDSVIAGAPGGAQSLAALAANPAVRTLFGEPVALDDAGGFTVWRTGTVLAVLIGTWAALAAVRVLRGAEEAGHWDLLLAGRMPLSAVTGRHLAVLTAAVLVVGGGVGAALLVTGTDPSGALTHGAALALTGAFFVGVGGLAAQVLPSRSGAAGAAVAVLLVGLLTRMVGDGMAALGWLRWTSPFGLTALARPYDADRIAPLVVLACAALVLLATATVLAGHRDLRGGVVAGAGDRRSRTALLGSVTGFAVRSAARPALGWAAGIGAFYLLIGLISKSMTTFLAENPQFAEMAAAAGFEIDAVQGYTATLFTLLAVPLGGYTATRIAAVARAESARRLDLLLAAPVTRVRLAGAETVVAAAGALVLTAVAGLVTWAGTAAVGVPLGPAALAGAANTLPVTALGLGAAVLALGWAPRLVVPIGMLPAGGGFLLTVLADSTGAPQWIAALSPFAHLARVPATAPDVPGAVALTAIALVLAGAGLAGFRRRDIRTG